MSALGCPNRSRKDIRDLTLLLVTRQKYNHRACIIFTCFSYRLGHLGFFFFQDISLFELGIKRLQFL